MDIFISWSGPKSGAVAEALRKWLPKIVNAFQPWTSSSDIEKGARWSADVAGRLATIKAGIICLTPGNLSAPWILFEAGALSKTLEGTFVCPLLIGLEPTDVSGPLAQFQATRATKAEVLKLLKTLNRRLQGAAMPDAHIDEAFEMWWPKLEVELSNLPSEQSAQRPRRTDRDLIEELVDLVRNQSRVSGSLSQAFRHTEAQTDTAFTVMRALALRKGSRGGLQIGTPIFRYLAQDDQGRKFEIAVPSDMPENEIEACVKQQIPSFDSLHPRNASRKPAPRASSEKSKREPGKTA